MTPTTWKVLVLGAVAASCKDSKTSDGAAPRIEPSAAVAATATLPPASVAVGFVDGRLNATEQLGAFTISKHPVTVGQYRTCVAAGVCAWADLSCANPEGADDDMAQCAGHDGAAAFCGWIGGELPILSQWLLAARGPSIRRFAWGDKPANCEQHPRATMEGTKVVTQDAIAVRELGLECGVEEGDLLRTAMHPAGASPNALEDVLLGAGELLRSDAGSLFSACAIEGAACVVFGSSPGAIEGVERVSEVTAFEHASPSVAHPYGFRCVSSQEAE